MVARRCRSVFEVYRLVFHRAVEQAAPAFPVPRTFAEALQLAADQQKLIEVMQPKAEYADRLLGSQELLDMETAAKVLRTSRNRLMKFLRERGVLAASNLPMQIYIDRGLMQVQPVPYKDVFGRDRTSYKSVLTPSGLRYVRSLLDSFTPQSGHVALGERPQ